MRAPTLSGFFRLSLPRLFVVSLVALPGVGLVSGCAPDDEVVAETTSSVIGGTTVSIATQRALGLVTVGHGCSGALISRDWALTATHCIPSFASPSGTTVKAPKTDGTQESRSAIALEQVGATDLTLVQMAASTATSTWPNVTNKMYPSSPANVAMTCYGLGPSLQRPEGSAAHSEGRHRSRSGPARRGLVRRAVLRVARRRDLWPVRGGSP